MELETNMSLPFLDVLISRKEDGSLAHQVFRKKTHTEKYLHANSHHFPPQKLGIITTLATRAHRISDGDHIDQELEHLHQVFRMNGYDSKQIKKIISKIKRNKNKIKNVNKNDQSKEEGKKIFLPYIKGTTDKLSKTLGKRGFKVLFTPPNSIRKMVDSLKDPIEPTHFKGVYSIPCSCNKPYIGETGRSIGTRLKEHGADLRHDRYKRSALAEHAHLTQHQICLENAVVVAREDNIAKRKIREKIEINMAMDCLNRDDGKKLSDTWLPLLHSLKRHG